jgi:hypothetical protein
MSDLIADLRQKLADDMAHVSSIDAFLRIEYPTGEIELLNLDSDIADWLASSANALPGLLDELEAARALIDHLPGLEQAIPWVDSAALVAAYERRWT